MFVLTNKILLKRSGEKQVLIVTWPFFCQQLITVFVLGTYVWGFKHQCYLHIYFDIPLSFLWMFSTISFYALSCHLLEARAIVRLDMKVKAQCFSEIDLRILAPMVYCMCLSINAVFVHWKG